jgi:3-dehydroquinate synthase
LPLPDFTTMLHQSFSVSYQYPVYFTDHLFHPNNALLRNFFIAQAAEGVSRKVLFMVDDSLLTYHPTLPTQLKAYFDTIPAIKLVHELLWIKGGEKAKNDLELFFSLIDKVEEHGIDRHSYVAAIGGGSVLDVAGFVAAVSHRGIRHIRIPTTLLAQDDSGVGVKNGINYKGKKNFLGAFAPPLAVFNDFQFLLSLSERDWRSGISEAVKVSLIKDRDFFEWLELNANALMQRSLQESQYLIRRCAQLHLEHIASGDPFESGSARPLDFGHWAAHKLEQLSGFSIRHGEAVACGLALDSLYAVQCGMLSEKSANRVLKLLQHLGFTLFYPLLEEKTDQVLAGLEEFREHLGGKLTITLLEDIGKGVEVHQMQQEDIRTAIGQLKQFLLLQTV